MKYVFTLAACPLGIDIQSGQWSIQSIQCVSRRGGLFTRFSDIIEPLSAVEMRELPLRVSRFRFRSACNAGMAIPKWSRNSSVTPLVASRYVTYIIW